MSRIFIALFITLIAIWPAKAQILLPDIISQNAIFQRDKPIRIWGKAYPKEALTINLGKNQAFTTADDQGNFQATLKAMKAGGPYRLNIIGKTVTNIDNIMIGEVWLAGGQSNMEWKISQLGDFYKQETQDAKYQNIRILTVKRAPALSPQENCKTSPWEAITPNTAQNTSAVAYFYALQLHKKLGVPIGIISSNWGGTDIETWCDKNAIQTMPGVFTDNTIDINQFKDFSDYEKALELSSKKKFQERLKEIAHTTPDLIYTSVALKQGQLKEAKEIQYPGNWEGQTHPNFDGIMWYHKTLTLPLSWNVENTLLSLGAIDDADSTFINGTFVGATNAYDTKRKYKIPANAIKEGNEVKILIKISDYLLGGGPWGDTSQVFLSDGTQKISLAGIWQLQEGINFKTAQVPMIKTVGGNPSAPGVLYNGMIKPLGNFTIRGIIFYHGSNNAPRAAAYQGLLESLITTWRNDFKDPKMPFLNVQIANFGKPQASTGDSPWSEIREAQRKAIRVGNYYTVNNINLGEADNIHPRRKKEVGERLAEAALVEVYKQSKENYKSPEIERQQIKGNKIIISFRNAKELRSTKGGSQIKGFAIAASDGKFKEAQARIINGVQVEISAKGIEKPRFVRYAWADNPEGISLVNERNLPAEPFRTDSFELSTKKGMR